MLSSVWLKGRQSEAHAQHVKTLTQDGSAADLVYIELNPIGRCGRFEPCKARPMKTCGRTEPDRDGKSGRKLKDVLKDIDLRGQGGLSS